MLDDINCLWCADVNALWSCMPEEDSSESKLGILCMNAAESNVNVLCILSWRGKSFWFKVHLLVDQRRLCAACFFLLEAFDLLNDCTALLPSTINCHVNRNMKSVWCLISISIYKINKWSWCGFHVMFAEGRLSSLVLLEPAALKYWCLSEVSGKWSRPWSL